MTNTYKTLVEPPSEFSSFLIEEDKNTLSKISYTNARNMKLCGNLPCHDHVRIMLDLSTRPQKIFSGSVLYRKPEQKFTKNC